MARFSVEEDEGSFFARYTLVDTLDKDTKYYDLNNPERIHPAIVADWVQELKERGRVTPQELRVALDLLMHYAWSYL